jgi:hypothetical protein
MPVIYMINGLQASSSSCAAAVSPQEDPYPAAVPESRFIEPAWICAMDRQ